MASKRKPSGLPALILIYSLLVLAITLSGCDRDAQQTKPSEDAQQDATPRATSPADSAASGTQQTSKDSSLSDAELQDLVERSYQYVAMYNVNNKFAASTGGWNHCLADTTLKDHTMRDIARPNNDTLYISCLLDLRADPVILEVPAFDTDYASLMVTAYDHYVNIPLSTRKDHFTKPQKILFYSDRTEGYDGQPVQGVEHIFKASGDFISAVFRVMPHGDEPKRFEKIRKEMQAVEAITLSEYRGEPAKVAPSINFPKVGKTDVDTFGSNLLEVMQFIFNHVTFDPNDPIDQGVLAIYQPLGVEPGKPFDSTSAVQLDNDRLRAAAEKVQRTWLNKMNDAELMSRIQPKMFQPKGDTDLETLLAVSIYGPIGVPREEAVYPTIETESGEPLNAQYDYVVHMNKDRLPPAGAFWSVTLYDLKNGFFIPNDRKKYSVGRNAGMKLNEDGGIDIYIAAKKPDGVPEENWLPIERKDEDLNLVLRIYQPDLEKLQSWPVPKAQKVTRDE